MQGLLQYMYEKRAGGGSVGSSPVLSRAQAEYTRDSLGRISQACLKGVLRFGGISALYFGTELAAGIYRAKRDYYNATCGGLVTGACSGALLARGGGVMRMGRGFVLGGALGGAIGFPAGLVQDTLINALSEEDSREREYRIQQMMTIAMGRGDTVKAFEAARPRYHHDAEGYDPVGHAIAHLEATIERNANAVEADDEKSKEQDVAEATTWFSWLIKKK